MEDVAMERMLVVVFDEEKKAYEGMAALRRLEQEGSLTVYARAVVVKQADGATSTRQFDSGFPIGGLVGTSVGSFIGLLGGPVGVALGAASGIALGALFDLDNARVGGDFVEDVSKSLTVNKAAVIAEVDEEWTTPVDSRMEALGGTVLRRALTEVRATFWAEQDAAMEADLAKLEEEASKARSDRRAKLQKKIDELKARIVTQRNKATERHQAFEARQKAKKEVLGKNAAAAGRALEELAKTPV
jgi:uncharacterized membrane protein